MTYESYNNYQYDSCIARGICSINPRLSALQTVIVLYLRLFAKYAFESQIDKETRDFILNTISITIYNPDFNENSFINAVKIFKNILQKTIENFYSKNPNDAMVDEKNKALELYEETVDIIKAIRYGEKIFRRALEKIPT